MSEVLPAALALGALALLALRHSRGELVAPAGLRSPQNEPPPPTASFDGWIAARIHEFQELCARAASSGSAAVTSALPALYAARGRIMEQLYARQRFMPNDTGAMQALDARIASTDAMLTRRIEAVRALGPSSARGVRWPLSCGDGDALLGARRVPRGWTAGADARAAR